tara:strand:- start:2287 stop:2544 length:258 start_codon:yes stop_codon:yes gene_type:complete
MKLPLIRTLSEKFDEDYLLETVEVLEVISETPSLKDEDIEVIGELISNTLAAIEVIEIIRDSKGAKDAKAASTEFMKRVLGSIGK